MVIEIANRIVRGHAVGTDYVVTRRDEGNSGIIARFSTREGAEGFITNTSKPCAGCSNTVAAGTLYCAGCTKFNTQKFFAERPWLSAK